MTTKPRPECSYQFHCKRCGFTVTSTDRDEVKKAKRLHHRPWVTRAPLTMHTASGQHLPCPVVPLHKGAFKGCIVRQDLYDYMAKISEVRT